MTERNRTDKLEAPSNAIGKILSFIRERRYQPSERLPSERDFAEKFETSRGAVREALAALETMRVIERRQLPADEDQMRRVPLPVGGDIR